MNKGEFISVVGANSSGKSILAKLIAGLLLPGNGQVFVNGMDTTNLENRNTIRRCIGLVLQNPENQLVAARVEEDAAFGPGEP
ncbi:MAG: ATP-binding cassette domain-containing protein [Clostridiales bacterium]|nr:ATP-binding cassette domain-containing protein [Clostridiales bacterium]